MLLILNVSLHSTGRIPGYKWEYNLVYTNAAIFHRELLNDYTCALYVHGPMFTSIIHATIVC